MLHYEHVEFAYPDSEGKKIYALQDLSLEVASGDFVAVIGHNGSGKSTLAKLGNVILLPAGGHVWVDGMDTQDEALLWQIRQTAGMVFQNPDNQIVATLVEEDVAFGPENLGLPPEEIRKRVDEALEIVGMTAYAHKPPHLLSGGQKQRIAIAGILAMRPRCIIFDEPTAMLDPLGRKEVLKTIHSLHQEGITIVLITHFMEEAVLADQVLVLEHGRKIIQGTPTEVFSQVETLQKLGLDVPQVTLLAHRLRAEGLPLPADLLTLEEMVKSLCQLL